MLRNDSWQNALGGLGDVLLDKRLSAEVAALRSNNMRESFERLYAGSDIAKRGVRVFPEEMTRRWPILTYVLDENGAPMRQDTHIDPEDIMQSLEKMDALCKITEALTWANVYGGGLIYLDVEDGRRRLSTPLDPQRVTSIRNLVPLDRWDVTVQSIYTDPRSAFYARPKYLSFNNPVAGDINTNEKARRFAPISELNKVHHTRFLIFDGLPVSHRRRVENNGWGDSLYISMWDLLRDFAQAWAGIFLMEQEFAQPVFRMKGMAEAFLSNNSDLVKNRLKMMDLARSVVRSVPLDSEEDFRRESISLGSLPDLLDRTAERLAIGFDMPLTRLMGRSPAGLNSTGEADTRFFYDRVNYKWENQVKRQFMRLVEIMMVVQMGHIPQKWSLRLPSLWDLSALDEAKRREVVSRTDKNYVEMGAISREDVGKSRFSTDEFGDSIKFTGTPDKEDVPGMGTSVPNGGTSAENPDGPDNAGSPGNSEGGAPNSNQ